MHGNIHKLLDGLILGLIAYLTHQTIFVWFYEYSAYGGSPQSQLAILVVIVLVIFLRMRFRNEEKVFLVAWQKNWLVGLFICLALLSLGWTVSLSATIYRSLLLLFVALIAAFVGLRLSARNLVIFIAIVVGVFALASLLLVGIFPRVAIVSSYPYEGLWRGIFWHKIYLGATMALGYITYLVILFSPHQQYTRVQKSLAAVMIVICIGLAILSDSASGLVVFAIQTGLFILVLCWLSWGHLVSRRVYWWLGGCMALAFLLIVTNLEFIFGLFNRSASMTGRVPLWLYLLKTYIAERSLLGHGFGAFWLQPGIMQKIQSGVGWPYPVRVSDNGYMDVLLGLGIIGLFLFLAMLATGLLRTIRSALRLRDLTSFLPFFVMVHIVFINISLSYFVENESFIWFLLVVVLFMYSSRRSLPSSTEP